MSDAWRTNGEANEIILDVGFKWRGSSHLLSTRFTALNAAVKGFDYGITKVLRRSLKVEIQVTVLYYCTQLLMQCPTELVHKRNCCTSTSAVFPKSYDQSNQVPQAVVSPETPTTPSGRPLSDCPRMLEFNSLYNLTRRPSKFSLRCNKQKHLTCQIMLKQQLRLKQLQHVRAHSGRHCLETSHHQLLFPPRLPRVHASPLSGCRLLDQDPARL